MAIGSKDKIQIELTLDNKGAIKSVKQFEAEVKKAGSGGATSIDSLSKSFFSLKTAIAGIGITALTASITSLAKRGAEVDGLTRSFEALQTQAGANATASIEKLRDATRGLVSDFELMKSANNAVLLGLPTEGFDKLAESATKLGLATGRTATEALNDLVTGVGRGSKLILDNLGILVDSTQAYENYARSIGVSVDALDEQQKKLAFQAEAFEQIKNKSQELSDVQLGAGNAVNKLGTSFSNLIDKVSSQLNQNDDLAQSFSNIADKIDEIDIDNLINLLGKAGSAFLDFSNIALGGINFVLDGWNDLLNAIPAIALDSKLDAFNIELEKTATQARQTAVEILKLKPADAFKELEPRIKGVEKSIEQAKKAFNEARKPIIELQKEIKKLESIENPVKKIFKQNDLEKLKNQLKEAQEQLIPLSTNLASANKELDIYRKLQGDIEKLEKKSLEVKKELTKEQKDYTSAMNSLRDTLKVITGSSGLDRYNDQLEDLTRQKKAGIITNNEYSESILKIAESFKTSEQLGKFEDRVKKIDGEVRRAKTGLEQLFGQDNFIGNALSDTKIGNSINSISKSLGEDVSKELASGLNNVFSDLLESGDFKQGAEDLGGVLGGAVGGKFGEAYGSKIGESLSGIGSSTGKTVKGIATILTGGLSDLHGVGDFLAGAFGGNKNAEANARSGFEKYIREVLDEKPLQVVIDDQLQKLDFTLSGGRDAFDGGGLFNTAFEGLSDDAIASFSGIGTALAESLGGGVDGSQIGAILSDNLGGSLNNLQILLKRLDVSAEQMGESVKDAWLTGDLSAQDALVSLQKIQQVTTQGIPDGIGFTTQALDNLVASAGSGEVVLDALGDLAVEAGEKGINSLEGLRQDLLANGADAEKVKQAFDSFASAGINSLEALKDVSVDAGLQISSTLEANGDFFDEKVAKLEDIKNRLDQIENKEVDIKFNIRSSIDSGTERAMNAGAFNASGTPNIGAEGVI
jgi:soluble cytochrome b562